MAMKVDYRQDVCSALGHREVNGVRESTCQATSNGLVNFWKLERLLTGAAKKLVDSSEESRT
jgi:hypothetical protein